MVRFFEKSSQLYYFSRNQETKILNNQLNSFIDFIEEFAGKIKSIDVAFDLSKQLDLIYKYHFIRIKNVNHQLVKRFDVIENLLNILKFRNIKTVEKFAFLLRGQDNFTDVIFQKIFILMNETRALKIFKIFIE